MNVILDKYNEKHFFYYIDTPKMWCYLFTFNLGNFDFIKRNYENNIKILIFTHIIISI